MAKALVASLTIAAALDLDVIGLDDPAAEYISEWENDPDRAEITLLDLATHSAGIKDVYFGGGTEPDAGWQGVYYHNPDQRFRMAITAAPIEFLPGTRYSYSGVGYYALAYALGQALRGANSPDVRALLRERIMGPAGIPSSDWSISYGTSHSIDGMQLYAIGSGGMYSARAVARIGQLMLNQGSWHGDRILSEQSVRSVTSYHDTPRPPRATGEPEPLPALGWWINSDGVWPSVPTDAYVGVGANHQILLVVPCLDLVAVRLGGSLGETHWGSGFWYEMQKHFLKPLMDVLDVSKPAHSNS
jgi:CubicO group peptidase (beta-lactamase class C family)